MIEFTDRILHYMQWVENCFQESKKPKPLETLRILALVPVTGLEPVRHRWRRILSPLRLPFHHTGMVFL